MEAERSKHMQCPRISDEPVVEQNERDGGRERDQQVAPPRELIGLAASVHHSASPPPPGVDTMVSSMGGA